VDLSEIESNAAPLLQSFDERWPFSGDDKLKLATLFAFQWLRSPRWKEQYEERTHRFVKDYDRRNPSSLTAEETEEFNQRLASDTHRLGMMLSTAVTGSAIFASMHWTLVEFDRPLIARPITP
jgi:hypothetical protein